MAKEHNLPGELRKVDVPKNEDDGELYEDDGELYEEFDENSRSTFTPIVAPLS